ncbi:MAG: zinc ABC transporter substrate-binding protein [Desulfobacterales bacterium]
MQQKRLLGRLILLFGLAAGLSASSAYGADAVPVFVSILPQKYFVERIGGDRVDVSVMVQPGANPAVYEPKPMQMAKLANARIYFAVGVPFESAWLEKFASVGSRLTIVQTQAGIKKRPMPAMHLHGNGRLHEPLPHSRRSDPHVWTSPPLVKILADNIHGGLSSVDPENASLYEANYRRFIEEINELDLRIRRILSKIDPPRSFMVYHPSWGYFADTYHLKQIPVELEGKAPKPAQLRRLIERAEAEGIKVIFAQPQFSTKSAEAVAGAIGGRVVYADPLAYDWPGNLLRQAEQFKAAVLEAKKKK